MKNVPALILAGGSGTRLRSVVADVPKPLAQIGGRPFITYLFDQLIAAGVTRVVVCIGYKADVMRSTLGTTYGPLALEFSEEKEPLGTGGGLRLALPLIGADHFLLLNGDSFCDASLPDFNAFHVKHGKPASLVAIEVADTSRYGQLRLGSDGHIDAFKEKHLSGGVGWINAGIYLLQTDLVKSIPENGAVSLERDLFPRWNMMAWPTRGRFIDIGTPESYAQAEAILRG
jgi:D-glycero-alpha-D-manno-heptose 1-phosphate guanylyltransferase